MTITTSSPPQPAIEILDARELGQRLRVPPSWILYQSRSRSADPIPHLKLGKYCRYEWGSPQLAEWLKRHRK